MYPPWMNINMPNMPPPWWPPYGYYQQPQTSPPIADPMKGINDQLRFLKKLKKTIANEEKERKEKEKKPEAKKWHEKVEWYIFLIAASPWMGLAWYWAMLRINR